MKESFFAHRYGENRFWGFLKKKCAAPSEYINRIGRNEKRMDSRRTNAVHAL